VPTIDPLWGEGIHKGMKSARAAAITADASLTHSRSDTSAEQLATYEELWHEDVAPRMNARLMLTELLYLVPNERYDQLMADLRRTGENTLEKLNSGNKLAMTKLMHLSDLPTLAKYARQRLNV